MTRRPGGDDDGVYAILYALLILTMLGIAALVVDLGALRQSRRESRLASDAAAIVGARDLDFLAGTANPRQACTDAWSYLGTNLGFTVPGSTGCTVFPTSVGTCPTIVTPYSVVAVGDYGITITWPVLDTDRLMRNPNVQPATVVQPIDPFVDGTNACSRIGVTVAHVNHPAFASVFGTGDVSTAVSSVARSTANPGGNGVIAALNVLEQTACNAILTSGQGYIQVKFTTVTDPITGVVTTRPGIIAVESSGTAAGNSCNGANTYVINPANNSSGAYIRADGAVTGDGLGTIETYALNPTLGNPAKAFNPSLVPPSGVLMRPKPTLMGERFGDSPVRNIYDSSTTTSYITQLKTAFGGAGTPTPYAASPAPYGTQSFITLPCTPGCPASPPGLNAFPANCTIGTQALVLIPAHNYYLNCNTLSVKGTLVFAGGDIVAKGTVDSTGCLAVNVPETLVATCPLLNLLKTDLALVPTTEGILYLRSGNLTKGSQGSMFLARTFTYMAGNGAIGIGGGGTGILLWTNPKPASPCTDTCADQRFGKLAFWTESTATQSLGGQSDMVMRGVLFMPKAPFTYQGATSINQTNAQFWTRTISVSGQSGLTMAPDPSDTVPRPELGTALIR